MKVTQISCFIENRPGRLHAACEALASRRINIHTLSLADTAEFGILRLIVAEPDAGKAALDAAGYVTRKTEVLAVEVPDDAGGLASVLAKADTAQLNIEYMYAFSAEVGARAVVIMRFSEPDRAVEALQRAGVNLVAPIALLAKA
ncbi:MAG: amino acid-binding protein [Uliginosibacterium sp.]|nr:amino acid-binding protein [Uliginosibacterium sp.]MBK9617009.1 amino acid-binding protein [Uliginosibacterium sp.]